MADYTDLPNTAVGVGGIPSGTTVTALRDNPIAIAEGAAGAPRVVFSAINEGVGGAAAGAVGTYVFALHDASTTFGEVVAGADLQPTSAARSVSVSGTPSSVSLAIGTALSGSWRSMGLQSSASGGIGTISLGGATLFLRIS